jgi:cysteine-rich repeat protein
MIVTTVLFLLVSQAPAGWSCDPARFTDAVCDCGCGVIDDDCASSGFAACDRDNCSPTQSPWEHENQSCMASACGDGWRKEGVEVCDDGDARDGGGCAADCTAVRPGFVCGSGADGCDAAGEGEGESDGGGSGCAATPVALPLVCLGLLRRGRRR